MKNVKTGIVFFILILSNFGCERGTIIREEIDYIDQIHKPCISNPAPIYLPGEMLLGRVAGLKNCLPFMASAELEFFSYHGLLGTNLSMFTFEDWGNHHFVRKETILVGALAYNTGNYSMTHPADNFSAGYATVQNFDVFEDVFRIDSFYDQNEITFSSLDRLTGHAQGFFNCRFLLASNFPSGHNPDTVVFTECHFDAWKR